MDEQLNQMSQAADPAMQDDQQAQQKMVPREQPTPEESRSQLVTHWVSEVTRARTHWASEAFDQMRADQKFVAGKQHGDPDYYVANYALRHLNLRTAALYAKNPKAVAKVRERLEMVELDVSPGDIPMLSQMAMMGDPNAARKLQAYEQARQSKLLRKRIAKTLELLYQYNVDEQAVPFKAGMKQTVRRAIVNGVGYVKLGFQRATALKPEAETRLNDVLSQLKRIEQLSADLADGEITQTDPRVEELRLLIDAIRRDGTAILREGIVFDYPTSTSIIPDLRCRELRHFSGCEWVAQEYMLDPEKIQQIWGVDVGTSYRVYRDGRRTDESGISGGDGHPDEDNSRRPMSCVFEIYHKPTGLVYWVCDGFTDFLAEPGPPDVRTERFWPWYALTLNETANDDKVFPPSDISLMRPMQQEINRSRQGLREHRRANRPRVGAAGGMLSDDDKYRLQFYDDSGGVPVIELSALQPGQKVEDLLQHIKGPGIDPNLYEVNMYMEDILRVLGQQEANFGSTAGGTATESSIAESSRMTSLQSNIDDLDELLTELARSAGQILLGEVSQQTVMKVVGQGAVWPQMSRQEIQEEVWLEVEAGSAGRPNQTQEIQNAKELMPFILQIPGISPEWLAREMLRRMDDRIDFAEAISAGPSIAAMNSMSQPPAENPMDDPTAQGAQGQNNAPDTGSPTSIGPPAPGDTNPGFMGGIG